jgi:hypothetical protein
MTNNKNRTTQGAKAKVGFAVLNREDAIKAAAGAASGKPIGTVQVFNGYTPSEGNNDLAADLKYNRRTS